MKGIKREEVKEIIERIGLPCAYYQFQEETSQSPPFICWFFASRDDMLADDTNYVDKELLEIELYTRNRDFDTEKQVEDVLKSTGLVFLKEPNFINNEKIWQIAYESEVIINESEE